MKALITGAAGFIGSHYVEMVLSGELVGIDEIIIIDKLSYAANLSFIKSLEGNPRVKFHKGNITDGKLVSRLMEDVDYVINFAAESHVDNSIKSAREFIDSNVVGVQTLLDEALNSNIKKFVQVSTDEVYGTISHGTWNEDSPLLPNSPYSASKASADLLCRSYFITHKLPVVITRCSNNFGPRQNVEKMIPKIIDNFRQGLKTPIYGDGNNVRDWLWVKDHCQGIDIVLKHGALGEIYNIGGGTELSNLNLVNLIAAEFGLKTDYIEFVKDRAGHDLRYALDYSKIMKLGYKPKNEFAESLKVLIGDGNN